MLKRNERVTFLREGIRRQGKVCNVVGGMAVVETGPMPVMGFFMTVPVSHVTSLESGAAWPGL